MQMGDTHGATEQFIKYLFAEPFLCGQRAQAMGVVEHAISVDQQFVQPSKLLENVLPPVLPEPMP